MNARERKYHLYVGGRAFYFMRTKKQERKAHDSCMKLYKKIDLFLRKHKLTLVMLRTEDLFLNSHSTITIRSGEQYGLKDVPEAWRLDITAITKNKNFIHQFMEFLGKNKILLKNEADKSLGIDLSDFVLETSHSPRRNWNWRSKYKEI